MCLCACACVTAAGSVGKRTGTIITRKKKQQQQRLTWPEFFRLTINKQNVSRFAVEAPGVGSLGLWRNSSHSYGKSEKRKKKKSRIAFKGGRDQISPSGWRREASGGIDETWGKTKNKYRQRRTRVWFARLCQTHTSLLLSPSLSQFLIVLLLLFFTFCQTSFHGKMKQKNDACLKNKIKKNVKMPFRPHWGWATSYKCAKHSSMDTRGKQVGCHWEVENYQERNFGAVGSLVRPLTVLNWINILI